MIIPKHVAIIMDGNGRWGLKKKKIKEIWTHSRNSSFKKNHYCSVKKKYKIFNIIRLFYRKLEKTTTRS